MTLRFFTQKPASAIGKDRFVCLKLSVSGAFGTERTVPQVRHRRTVPQVLTSGT